MEECCRFVTTAVVLVYVKFITVPVVREYTCRSYFCAEGTVVHVTLIEVLDSARPSTICDVSGTGGKEQARLFHINC